ncbi:Panacea domain-containing protein [Moraxella sp. ZJ142]|uniref:Panacea domain-containing protein n=1 Tax=Moraxella marmotae TaxID=3344520 RepID=UPI0035D49239
MENSHHITSASAVANEFIGLGKQNNAHLTVQQILKLTYIAQGYMLAFFDVPLFDDDIEAWKYGPIIPNLYAAIKHHGGDQIHVPIRLLKGESHIISDDAKRVIDFVYKKYAHLSGIQLSALTNQPSSPWAIFFNDVTWGRKIPTAIIKEYYDEKLAELIKDYESRKGKTL